MGGWVAGWVGGAFWVEETAMPRLQAKGRGEAAELEGARELQRSVYWLSRGKNTVGDGGGLEEALFKTWCPWGLPGILSEEAVLMVSFLPFPFLFPFSFFNLFLFSSYLLLPPLF